MRAVVQRVSQCVVTVGHRETGRISRGLLVYLGVGARDTEKDLRFMTEKVLNLRIFPDQDGRMNLCVRDIAGEILVVSQFTVYGDVRDGRRPSYSDAAPPDKARALYQEALSAFAASGLRVASGEFAAAMEVSYTNVGPVTILVDSEKKF